MLWDTLFNEGLIIELTYTKLRTKITLNLVFGLDWPVRVSAEIFFGWFFKTFLDFSCSDLSVKFLHLVFRNDVHLLVNAQVGLFLVQLVQTFGLEGFCVFAFGFFVDWRVQCKLVLSPSEIVLSHNFGFFAILEIRLLMASLLFKPSVDVGFSRG